MIARHLTRVLGKSAQEYPVVSVTGPRQSGKTTLVRAAFPGHAYVSLEDPDERSFALEDPRGFLDRFAGPAILDEIQRVPDLFSYLQTTVDETGDMGRFIITGSQNFLLLHQISQTLAGRCAVLQLLPFSRAELEGRRPTSLDRIGTSLPRRRIDGEADLFRTVFTGGYPPIHDRGLDPRDWLANYTRTYLERDVRDLLNVGDAEAFSRFVRLCAGRCGHLLNLSGLAGDAGISHATAWRWLSILEAGYLVILLRPHHRNFNKRLIKAPKLYFLDTGLLCYLLRIRDPDDLRQHAARGAVFETWVISEAVKTCRHRGVEPDLFFWRDSTGREIDLIIDRGGTLAPVEIKSGQTISEDFFRGLRFWRGLPGQAQCPAALVYGGADSYRRGGVTVLSWQHWL